jgi:hypothetical protein
MQRIPAAVAVSARLYQLPEQYIEKLSDYRDDVRGRYGRDLAWKYGDRQRCPRACRDTAISRAISAWDIEACHHNSELLFRNYIKFRNAVA